MNDHLGVAKQVFPGEEGCDESNEFPEVNVEGSHVPGEPGRVPEG